MEAGLLSLISRAVGLAAANSARPATTFFCVQVVVALLVRLDLVVLPPSVAWTVSFLALGVGFSAMAVEWVIQHSTDAEELFRELYLDRVAGALATVPATLILVMAQAPAGGDGAAAGDGMASAVQVLATSDRPGWQQVLILVVAVGINQVLVQLRGGLLRYLDESEQRRLKRAWQWLESGGVGVALVLLVFAPPILLGIVALLTVVLGVLFVVLWRAERALDRRSRRPCPACEEPIRDEASLCRACGAEVEPVELLGGGG